MKIIQRFKGFGKRMHPMGWVSQNQVSSGELGKRHLYFNHSTLNPFTTEARFYVRNAMAFST